MLLPGHVIRAFDPTTAPPKQKRLICVCPQRRLFLRINSNPFWPPHHPLRASHNEHVLEHDSYVELRQLLRFGQAELARALQRQDAVIGRMSRQEATAVAWAARRAETLSDEWQRLVWERLAESW